MAAAKGSMGRRRTAHRLCSRFSEEGEKTQRERLHLHQKKGGSDGEGEGHVIYSGGPTILG